MTNKFDTGYKILHWLMAVLVLLMFMAKFGFEQATTEAERLEMLLGHSSIGTVIAVLALIRIYKRFIKKDAVPSQRITRLSKTLSRITQYSMYFLLVYIPLTGYLSANFHDLPVMLFANFDINGGREYDEVLFGNIKSAHQLGISLLLGLLVLHIVAALFHGLIKRDGVMTSMVGFKKD